MAITESQRRQRRKYIGSSDAPALAGVDPFGRTQVDVWLEKTGRLLPEKQTKQQELNSPRVVGTYLEGGILSWVQDLLGTKLARDQFKIHPNGISAANFDALALVLNPPAIVEAKTAGMFGRPKYFEDFGEPFTDEVPDHVRVQGHHQLLVADGQKDLPKIDLVLVPALLVSRGFVLYRVPRNQDLCDALREIEEEFWPKYVLADEEPPEIPTWDSLKRVIRLAEPKIPVDKRLIEDWQKAKETLKLAEQAKDEATRMLISALGEYEVGESELGEVTFREQTRGGYEVEETTFRTLRFRKAKAGKGKKGP